MSLNIQPEHMAQRTKGIDFSRLGDELLAIDDKTEHCYSLNYSAARVWELIATPVSVDSICVKLSEEFAVDNEQCLADVVQLLQVLEEAGLARVIRASSVS